MRKFLWVILALLAAKAAAVAQPAGTKDPSGVGYPTVASALDGMRSKGGVRVSNQDGWTVIEDGSTMSIWSFTPAGHPAHPAVIRRTVAQQGSDISVQMAALCEAKKPACDKLVAEFQELTKKLRESLGARRSS